MFRTPSLVAALASALRPAAKHAYWQAGRKILRAPGLGSRIG
jgi:hypothetical protein